MRVTLKYILSILLFVFVAIGWASAELTPWFSRGENNQVKLRVDLFFSSTCIHCQKADAFFRDLESKESWLDVHRYMINQDKAGLEAFHQELQQQKSDDYSVPSIFFCDSHWVGFDEAGSTGRVLLSGLNYCQQQITNTGHLNTETVNVLKQWANANWLKASMASQPSTVSFIPEMALADAFSSCSIFCILALFSFLWLYQKRSIQIGLGILFIVVLAVVHHVQQGHTIFFYQALTWLRIPAILIGLGLIVYVLMVYFKGSEHQTFAIPVLVALTAMSVQAYQQTCTPNFALVFDQWLVSRQFSFFKEGFYEGIYHTIYVIPLLLLMLCFIFFREHKRLDKFQTMLTCSAWCILLIIGGFLIFYPQGFSNFGLSLAALILSLLTGWLVTRRKPPRV